MSKASWGRIPSQDLQHRPQRFRRQVLLLEPHAVFGPLKVPHPARVALERSNATLEELLHHFGRRHVECPQTLEAAPDEGEPGAHEHLVIPARVGYNRQGWVREQGLGTPTSTYSHCSLNLASEGGRPKSIPEAAVSGTAKKLTHPEH